MASAKRLVVTDENIYQIGELLILDIKKFGGTTQLSENQIDERFGEDKDVLKGIQDLLLPEDRNLLDALQQVRQEVYTYVGTKSLPFDIPLFHWIRKIEKQNMNDYLNQAKERFRKIAEEFTAKWGEIETRFAEKKPKLYQPDKYPTKEMILARFRFNWKWKEVMPSDDPAELKREVGRMKQYVLRVLKKSVVDRMEALARSCADGKINQKTLESIDNQIFSKYKTLFDGFIDSVDIQKAIEDMQAYLEGTDAEMLRSDDEFRSMVEKKAKEVMATVSKVREAKDDRALIF